MVSFDAEETNTSRSSVVLLGHGGRSGERRLVAQGSSGLGGGWSRLVVGLVGLGLIDTLNVLSVGVGNVGGAGVEEHQQDTHESSPRHGHILDTHACRHVGGVEGVLGQHRDGGQERREAGNEEQGNDNQHNHHLVDDDETKSQAVNKEGKGGETKSYEQESERKSGQVVVGVSVVEEVLGDALRGAEVVRWGDWVGGAYLADGPVGVVTNAPEGPSRLGVCTLDGRGVGLDRVECVEGEVVGGAR